MKNENKPSMLWMVLIFFIFLFIGFIIGLAIGVIMITLFIAVAGAIGIILGSVLALFILFTLLFVGKFFSHLKVGFYGLIIGIIISVVFNHPLLNTFSGNLPMNFVLFIIPLTFIIAIIILAAMSVVVSKYKIVKRKDLVVVEDKAGTYRKNPP